MAFFGRNEGETPGTGVSVPTEITSDDLATNPLAVEAADLPDYVTSDEVETQPTSEWNLIPLGVDPEGREIKWNARVNPSLVAVGGPGSGKTNLFNIINRHCCSEEAGWIVLAFDLDHKLVKADPLPGVTVIDTIEVAADAASQLREIIEERYSDMQEAGVNHFDQLTLPTVPVLVVFSSALFDNETSVNKLAEVMRVGRAAGVFVAILAEDAHSIPGHILAETSFKVALSGSTAESLEGFFSFTPNADLVATLNTEVAGRALIQVDSALVPVQLYADPEYTEVTEASTATTVAAIIAAVDEVVPHEEDATPEEIVDAPASYVDVYASDYVDAPARTSSYDATVEYDETEFPVAPPKNDEGIHTEILETAVTNAPQSTEARFSDEPAYDYVEELEPEESLPMFVEDEYLEAAYGDPNAVDVEPVPTVQPTPEMDEPTPFDDDYARYADAHETFGGATVSEGVSAREDLEIPLNEETKPSFYVADYRAIQSGDNEETVR